VPTVNGYQWIYNELVAMVICALQRYGFANHHSNVCVLLTPNKRACINKTNAVASILQIITVSVK